MARTLVQEAKAEPCLVTPLPAHGQDIFLGVLIMSCTAENTEALRNLYRAERAGSDHGALRTSVVPIHLTAAENPAKTGPSLLFLSITTVDGDGVWVCVCRSS